MQHIIHVHVSYSCINSTCMFHKRPSGRCWKGKWFLSLIFRRCISIILLLNCSQAVLKSIFCLSLARNWNKQLRNKLTRTYMHLSTCKMQLHKPYIDLICLLFCYYIEGITWWREDMNFIFEWQNRKWVKYCFCHEKIEFISSSRRVMFFL